MKHIVAVIAILAPLGGIEALVVITPVIGLVLAIIQLVVLFIAKRLLLHLTSSVYVKESYSKAKAKIFYSVWLIQPNASLYRFYSLVPIQGCKMHKAA